MSRTLWVIGLAGLLLGPTLARAGDNPKASRTETGRVQVEVQLDAKPSGKAAPKVIVIEEGKPVELKDHVIVLGEGPERPGPYWIGLSVEPASEAVRKKLHLSKDGGLVVEHVMPRAPPPRPGSSRVT